MNKPNYKIVNGTYYHEDTPDAVIIILEKARQENRRIRIFYGDVRTGRDYLEHYDIMGTIGRSTGSHKIPLLINNRRSIGGTAILDNHIVKITVDKTSLYVHPRYHLPNITIEQKETNDFGEIAVTGYSLYANKECIYNCNSLEEIDKELEFLMGKRNTWY